jgi:hypothetical protein
VLFNYKRVWHARWMTMIAEMWENSKNCGIFVYSLQDMGSKAGQTTSTVKSVLHLQYWHYSKNTYLLDIIMQHLQYILWWIKKAYLFISNCNFTPHSHKYFLLWKPMPNNLIQIYIIGWGLYTVYQCSSCLFRMYNRVDMTHFQPLNTRLVWSDHHKKDKFIKIDNVFFPYFFKDNCILIFVNSSFMGVFIPGFSKCVQLRFSSNMMNNKS